MTYTPKVKDKVTYPSGSGIVVLPPDKNGIIIVDDHGEYKRVSATSCLLELTEKEKAVKQMMEYGSVDPIEFCESLYENGYRKVKDKDKAIAFLTSEFECCGVCSSESRERAKHIYKMIIEG